MTLYPQSHSFSEAHYRLAMQSTRVGMYSYDLHSRRVVWSDECKALLGLPSDAQESYDLLLSVVYPEDRGRIIHLLAGMDLEQLGKGIEHRVIWPDESVHWVLTRAGATYDEQREPVCLLGVVVDITRLKQEEERRRRADCQVQQIVQEAQALVKELECKQAFLNALMEQAPSALVIADAPSGKIVRYNHEAGKMLDKGLLESQHYTHYPPRWHEDGTLFRREEYPLVRAIIKGEVVVREKMRYRRRDGQMVHLEVSAAPIYDEEGQMLAAVATFHDLSERFELERTKDEFICVASHELRTPLTSIKGNLQLMQHGLQRLLAGQGGLGTEVNSILEHLMRCNERALQQTNVESRLVNDLLDATRLQSGELHVSLYPCNLVQVVQQAVEDLRIVACGRVIDLDLSASREIAVLADKVRIGQVVSNFVSNALKYSSAQQPVEVGIGREMKQARVWVRDYGPGLSPETQHAVWKRFRPATTFTEYGGLGASGLGLGLHFNREFIRQHGGETGVESIVGKGSTFWFTLPLVDTL